MNENKWSNFKMRIDSKDKRNIEKLAEQMNLKYSDAVRCAIEYALECGLQLRMEKTREPSRRWKEHG